MLRARRCPIALLALPFVWACHGDGNGTADGPLGLGGGLASGGALSRGGTNQSATSTTLVGSTVGGVSSASISSGGQVTTAGGPASTVGRGGSTQTSSTARTGGVGSGDVAGGSSSVSRGGRQGSGGTVSVSGNGTPGGATGRGGATGQGGATHGGSDSAIAGAPTGGVTGSAGAGVNGAIYVAPDGDDANPGSLAKPLRSLVKARDLVRTLNGAMTSDITVYLRGGTYPLPETATFTNVDSGKNGFYVKYMAYPNERPLLTGGQPITGWKESDAGKGIYSVSGITARFRQLYVNGVKAIRARTPNLGANGAYAFNRTLGFDRAAHTIQINSSEIAKWNNFEQIEMHLMLMWADNVVRLASYSTSGTTANLKFQATEDAILFPRPYPQLDFPNNTKYYYFENAFEFLDQPGEWYLDEAANVLYYKPRSGEDLTKATVVAPMVETLLSIKGASTGEQVGYLWFQGLTFAHSTYLRPSTHGFLDGQAGQYNLTATSDNKQTVGRPAAGVSVTNANHIRFERNLFTQMAATGLDFISGTHDDLIVGNVFADIGGSGISLGKFTASDTTEFHVPYNPSDKAEICTSDTIKNNYISNVTTEIQGGCGIAAGYPKFLEISHNEIAYANYTGISVGFGWTTTANAMSNNKINYNNVHHIEMLLADGAAIYTLSNQGPASEIQYNYIHDYSQSKWADFQIAGLYLDEGTAGYTVANNVATNVPTAIFQNHTGTNSVAALGSSTASVSAAGIEAAYSDIKNVTAPLPTF
jgi:hypothetical protein